MCGVWNKKRLFRLCHKVVRLGINPMIQPELEDLPKDNLKLEIAVLRMKKKCMDKGSKERSPSHKLLMAETEVNTYAVNESQVMLTLKTDIWSDACTTLPAISGFFSQKLISYCHGDNTLAIDISREIVDIE
ncbi:hypothetical protein Tco_0362677 [Tanacetum coccineum]